MMLFISRPMRLILFISLIDLHSLNYLLYDLISDFQIFMGIIRVCCLIRALNNPSTYSYLQFSSHFD